MSGANDAAAEGFSDGLVAEADAEDGNFAGEVTDEFDADPGFARRTGTGRDHDFFRTQGCDLPDRDLIVAPHLNLSAQFADVLDEVVSEGIVVVENENHACARG